MTPPDIRARRIGRESLPIAVIDGFVPDPDALRGHALTQAFAQARNHYPGVRAALPPDYIQAQAPLLAAVLAEVFEATTPARVLDASFSMVTTPPEALRLPQRMPHVDATSPKRIALVHYLSIEPVAGTAFFRHRATGYEFVDEARSKPYLERLHAEITSGAGPSSGYIASNTALFERTHLVEAVYNRAVIYRSNLLHSGAIEAGAALSADPANGRLTVTAFLTLE